MSTEQRRLREKELRRQTILNTAERIFAEKGFNETPMEEIAEAAELSKGTLYLYFKSKEELAFAIFHKNLLILKDMIRQAAQSAQTGIDKVRAILSAYYRFYKDHLYLKSSQPSGNRQYLNRLLGYYFQGDHTNHPYAERCFREIQEIISYIVSALQEGIRDGSIRREIDPGKTAMTYGNLVLLFMLHLAQGGSLVLKGHGYSAEELFDYMFDLFLHALIREV
ncbi:MAG: TetR/AcrR family transcriptional regulator [Spirochaetes bacterium]|nr:TetR/AcrR family transcriptional regulator [Spirochaetota bacterium]